MVSANRDRLEGIIVPLSTPLDAHYQLDRPGMKKLIDHVLAGGIHGVFALGSCGEYPCFDDRESLEIADVVVNEVAGRVPVLVNATRNSTSHSITIAKEFAHRGVDYVVMSPPFYYPQLQQDDLYTHFSRIAESGLPVALYNLPSVAPPIGIDTLERLVHHQDIVALKDSSGNQDYFAQAASLLPTFAGDDSLILPGMKRGGIGGVPGTANLIPKALVKLYTLYQQNRIEEAEIWQKKITAFKEVVYTTGKNAPVGVKHGLHYLGISGPSMRPPLPQIEQDEATKINTYLQHCELFSC